MRTPPTENLMIYHGVYDYAAWRKGYDKSEEAASRRG